MEDRKILSSGAIIQVKNKKRYMMVVNAGINEAMNTEQGSKSAIPTTVIRNRAMLHGKEVIYREDALFYEVIPIPTGRSIGPFEKYYSTDIIQVVSQGFRGGSKLNSGQVKGGLQDFTISLRDKGLSDEEVMERAYTSDAIESESIGKTIWKESPYQEPKEELETKKPYRWVRWVIVYIVVRVILKLIVIAHSN